MNCCYPKISRIALLLWDFKGLLGGQCPLGVELLNSQHVFGVYRMHPGVKPGFSKVARGHVADGSETAVLRCNYLTEAKTRQIHK